MTAATFDVVRYQDPRAVQRVLHTARTIAVVGLSSNELRASYFVGYYLRRHGYQVIPVNPRETEILGETCYPSLGDIPGPVDVVDVFRAPDALPGIAREAVAIGASTMWCQFGVVNAEGARIAEEGGLTVVMDLCIKIEHARYLGRMHWLGFNTHRITSVRTGSSEPRSGAGRRRLAPGRRGWGRRAADFASLSEPSNAREYVAMHRRLHVGSADRMLDLACGSGLALELAAAAGGGSLAGIDASPRLVDVARSRVPEADLRVGDMHDLPWPDGSFDVVTSFRGIWGTTPDALVEARRVLVPGGRLGLTVWGHIKASPGAWMLAPFRLAAEPQVAHQAAMVALGRPGVGEELLTRQGFVGVERVRIPFAAEFADPETFARALAATGPAYEAILRVGEDSFHDHAVALATEHQRAGLPLRAEIDVVGFLARTPSRAEPAVDWPHDTRPAGFLGTPAPTLEARALYDEDLDDLGFVMNVSRLWAHQPAAVAQLFDLMGAAARAAGLTFRERGALVLATAATLGDSYCSLAWGGKVATAADPELAAAVLQGTDTGLGPRERALARWARAITGDPNATTAADVEPLRAVGFDDAQLLALTLFAALRMAFSTVNDALGAVPDAELVAELPGAVREVVDWGRLPDVST